VRRFPAIATSDRHGQGDLPAAPRATTRWRLTWIGVGEGNWCRRLRAQRRGDRNRHELCHPGTEPGDRGALHRWDADELRVLSPRRSVPTARTRRGRSRRPGLSARP